MSSIDNTAPEEPGQLGSRLREARLAARISVRELARSVGVSASFVSQVELGRAAPSVGTLYAIASHLKLSLDDLMSGDKPANAPLAAEVPKLSVVESAATPLAWLPSRGELPNLQRADERPTISLGNVQWERLTAKDDDLVEFLRITYPSGSESCSPDNLQRHDGWEFGHVLEGRLDVEVAFNRGTLNPGDSINFNSTTPHRLSNPHPEDCVAIWVVIGRQGRGRLETHVAGALAD